MRRDFDLPEEDEEFLTASGYAWETIIETQVNPRDPPRWLVIADFPIPEGYNHQRATIALRLPPSYPDDQIDMAYFAPSLALRTGHSIKNLSDTKIDGKSFQQWSRHRTAENPWRPGLDNVGTHLVSVRDWLIKELKG